MTEVPLYRYHDPDGVVVVTPNKRREEDTPELLRLVADEGCLLTKDGENYYYCIDTETADGWTEVPENELPEIEEI